MTVREVWSPRWLESLWGDARPAQLGAGDSIPALVDGYILEPNGYDGCEISAEDQ